MAVEISTAGLSTTAIVADQVSILATYTEKLCNSYCINSSLVPQSSVSYSYGTPILNGTTVFVPITATISILTTGCCNCARTKLYTETFSVAFQGQTAVPTSVTITSLGRTEGGASVHCCMASSYSIKDSLTILIA